MQHQDVLAIHAVSRGCLWAVQGPCLHVGGGGNDYQLLILAGCCADWHCLCVLCGELVQHARPGYHSNPALVLAQVGIASVWYEGNPCNMHLLDLAEEVKKGVQQAGMVGYRFNTVGVSDAISMGTSGMGYSLPSRDLIADSIETTMGGQW